MEVSPSKVGKLIMALMMILGLIIASVKGCQQEQNNTKIEWKDL